MQQSALGAEEDIGELELELAAGRHGDPISAGPQEAVAQANGRASIRVCIGAGGWVLGGTAEWGFHHEGGVIEPGYGQSEGAIGHRKVGSRKQSRYGHPFSPRRLGVTHDQVDSLNVERARSQVEEDGPVEGRGSGSFRWLVPQSRPTLTRRRQQMGARLTRNDDSRQLQVGSRGNPQRAAMALCRWNTARNCSVPRMTSSSSETAGLARSGRAGSLIAREAGRGSSRRGPVMAVAGSVPGSPEDSPSARAVDGLRHRRHGWHGYRLSR